MHEQQGGIRMTKEELLSLKNIKAEIEMLENQLNHIEPEFVIDSVKGSSAHYPYTQHTVKIEGIDSIEYDNKVKRIRLRLSKKHKELLDEKDKLTEYICGIGDSEIRQIFMYRYIDCLTWPEIAKKMNYGSSTIRLKHDTFIKKIPG